MIAYFLGDLDRNFPPLCIAGPRDLPPKERKGLSNLRYLVGTIETCVKVSNQCFINISNLIYYPV